MPAVLIEVRRSYTREQQAALIDAVHGGLRDALRLPEWDRTVRLVTHDAACFAASPRLKQPENFTLITINLFAGRSLEAKRALYRGIRERLEALGIARDHVNIVLVESERENWGLRGVPGSEIELGFKVEV
ncbi:MAG TPA: tautomerase family protein [Nevskiaceae bacterium]|nr:tautomerase family protein [Nevskiaceae bacterium]